MKFLDNDGLEYMVGKIAGLVGGSGSADFIVEQGTSGYWTYRKWASGLVEMWGSKSFTLNITTSWGNGFYYSGGSDSNYILLSYPSGMFIQTPTCFCQVSSSGASVMVMPTGLNSGGTSSTPAYHAVRSGSFSNCAVQAEFYVKGYWKEFKPSTSRNGNNVRPWSFVASSGTTIHYNSVIVTNGVALGGVKFKFNASGSGWRQLGTTNDFPLISTPGLNNDITTPLINLTNGTWLGELQVRSDGTVQAYYGSTYANDAFVNIVYAIES